MTYLNEFLILRFLGKSGLEQSCVSIFLQSFIHGIVIVLCMKLREHKDLKLTQLIVFGKILPWSFWAKRGPK